jgi:Transposase DNA-binding/Transposase Tn5 dimerisation domain
MAIWAEQEMATVDFHDQRLNQRSVKLLSDLGQQPQASIPAACRGRKEMDAAYRFFENGKVTPPRILEPHIHQTRERIKAQQTVVFVTDTTELDVTKPSRQVQGAGPLDHGARRGGLLHYVQAFAPDETPLGTVWQETIIRDDEKFQRSHAEKREQRKAAAIEEKESFRWVKGLRVVRELAQDVPQIHCICVADSEADIYEVLAEPRGTPAVDLIIRACQNRAVIGGTRIWDYVGSTPVLFTKEISVRGRKPKTACETRHRRQPRKNRRATVEVRSATVTLRPPPRPDRRLPQVQVNLVLVREVNPPAGEEPVEWLLVTTLPIETLEQVSTVIHYYSMRWLIELFFRTFKSCCRVEHRRFETIERMLRCAALYSIVAWRAMYACRLGRTCPDADCEAIFEPSEWKSVYVAVHRQPPPKVVPRLMEMIKLVAELGGYINGPHRKNLPGPQSIAIGMQRMHDLAWGWDTFGPDAHLSPKNLEKM